MSLRARSWLARTVQAGGIADDRTVQVIGGVAILAGLDYHHDQFVRHLKRAHSYFEQQHLLSQPQVDSSLITKIPYRLPTAATERTLAALDHEAVAYLNRLGQFAYFAKAMDLQHLIPQIDTLLPFRHKHTAHRSIDMPRKESPTEREWQAMAFGFFRLTINQYPVYQLFDDGRPVNFNMRDDHPQVMNETMNVFQAIFPVPLDS